MPQITFTYDIPQGETQNYISYFTTSYPIPMNEAGEPAYTAPAWIRRRIRQFIFEAVKEGKKRIDSQSIIDLNEDYLT